jgi:CHASE3 domain sensor protein
MYRRRRNRSRRSRSNKQSSDCRQKPASRGLFFVWTLHEGVTKPSYTACIQETSISAMYFSRLQTGTRILGAFAVVSLAIVLISIVSLWRMHDADHTTRDLVENKLARQQAASELLGVARLNGARAVSIARSDSLELGDYFQAQLSQGEQEAAAIEARLRKLPAGRGEAELADRAARARAEWLDVRKQVFQAKEFGKTQEVEQLTANELARAFDAYTGALASLLAAADPRGACTGRCIGAGFHDQPRAAAGLRRRGPAGRLRCRLAAHAQHRRAAAAGGGTGRTRCRGRPDGDHRAPARRRDRPPVRCTEPHDGAACPPP